MTTFNVTTNTNFQDLVGAAGNDTFNITLGAILTIDTDTRYCTNHSPTTGNIGPMNVTNGKLLIDGRGVRIIPFDSGTGNVPAIGTSITQGGVSGYLLGVWASFIVAPTAAGSAMPVSGWIKIKNKNGGNYGSGALGGIGANATGADVVGWIEVVGIEAATITCPRLGKVEMKGEWFDVGLTNGAANQTIQMPASLVNTYAYMGVWIETAPSSGVYEFYPCAGTATTTRIDIAGKVVWISSQGLLRIGNSGAAANGYVPVSGCKIRVGNILTLNVTSAAMGTNVVPNVTLATRYDFTTTGGAVIEIDKVNLCWYPSFAQAYSVSITYTGICEQLQISELGSPIVLNHAGIGQSAAVTQYALLMSLCFAGGNIDNCVWTRGTIASSGNYVNSMTDCFGFVFTNDVSRSLATHGNATTGIYTLTRVFNCTWTVMKVVGAKAAILTTCGNLTFTTVSYCDVVSGTTGTGTGQFLFSINASSYNIKVNGIDFWGLANVNPYAGMFTILTGSGNIKIRNMGTAASPLSLGPTNAAAYFIVGVAGAGVFNVELKRLYFTDTRTGLLSNIDNSHNGFTYENVWTDTADTFTITALNVIVKGMKCTNATAGQTAVYGVDWFDIFTAATTGRVGIQFNEKTNVEPHASAYEIISGGTAFGFNSIGSIIMPNLTDEIIFTLPYWVLGYTAFTNTDPTRTGVNTANFTIQYKIDTGSGYNAEWKTLNGATISQESISPTVGFKLKIRITINTANVTNALSCLTIPMTCTAGSQQAAQYPLDVMTLTLTGIIEGSEIEILEAGTQNELAHQESSGTSYDYVYSYTPNIHVDIIIHKVDYEWYVISNYLLSSTGSSIPVAQRKDRVYSNP